MPSTTHCEPKRPAPSSIRAGRRTAAEFTLTFSAPASSTRRMSSVEPIPPPTAKGTNSTSATRSTVWRKIPRRSGEAVMS
jgi:hypothetical protein